MNKNTKKLFATRARETACKLCGSTCIASYDCPKKSRSLLPLVGKEAVCPLAKYDVPEAPARDSIFGPSVTMEDLFYACADCKHAKVFAEGDEWVLDRESSYEAACIDCPVQMCRDNIHECMAEAAMS